jgi:hypothetical protein
MRLSEFLFEVFIPNMSITCPIMTVVRQRSDCRLEVIQSVQGIEICRYVRVCDVNALRYAERGFSLPMPSRRGTWLSYPPM